MIRACPLCGATAARTLFSVGEKSYSVVSCKECGLRYTRPLPTHDELEDLYNDGYYVTNNPRKISLDIFRRLFQMSVLWKHRQAFSTQQGGRILDVGCGNGDFLASLSSRGWETHGIEFSTAASALARSKGITVHQGSLESANFPNGFFNVVTLWHVFEHLPNPANELREAQRILCDDGLLIIEVPNSASLTFKLCKADWYGADVPRHFQHFTPSTLRRILRRAAFEPVNAQVFHHWDFTFSFYSIMNRMGLSERIGIRHFSTDYKRAPLAAKAFFLLIGIWIGLFSLPYSIITTLITGNSETMTIISRKVKP